MKPNIRDSISNLDYKYRKTFFNILTLTERKKVLHSLETNKTSTLSKKIFEKINKAKETPINTSKKENRTSKIAQIHKNLKKTWDEVAYFFGFITARKAQNLANKYLNISKNHLNTSKNYISSNKLRKILIKQKRAVKGTINLKEILKEHGYPPILSECTFNKPGFFLRVDLKDITFQDCHFQCHFTNRSLSEAKFDSCNFSNASFLNTQIDACKFHNCYFRETMFTDAKIDSSNFSACSIIGSSFEDASIINTIFRNSSLHATHFLEASVKESSFIECNLKNTVFFDASDDFSFDEKSKKTVIINQPTTAILIDPESRGITTPKAYMKLDRSAHTIPLRIAMRAQKASSEEVNEEIQTILEEIGPYDQDKPPIPQQLIKILMENPDKYAESIKILKKAERLSAKIDSFFLPGGEDVPPTLYGQQAEEHTHWGNDYRRSILELSIIHQSFNKGIPLMGVCRGFQISNVYFGAQLLQDMKGQRGIQKFQLTNGPYDGIYHKAFKKPIEGVVFHHQGISKENAPKKHLKPAVIYQDLIKASELEYAGAVPMILLQFHPEFYKAPTAHNMKREYIDKMLEILMSESNEVFWTLLSDSAKIYRAKKTVHSELTKKILLQ